MKKAITLMTIIYAFICSCVSGPSQPTVSNSGLTTYERHICDSLGIDSSILLSIRAYTDSSIQPFPDRTSDDSTIDTVREKLPGLLFGSSRTFTNSIMYGLYDKLHSKGYTIFAYDNYAGFNNKAYLIGILRSVNKYEILKQIHTDGINYNIDNDSLLSIIRKFDEKYALQLVGAAQDWCEFRINAPHVDWKQLAKEAYKVCPDIVDQGTETIDKLADEMKRTRYLYFWWD